MGTQCQAFVDDLLASHSTDLQQRAYELQAFLALSPDIVASVMPENSSSEEIEVHPFPPLTVTMRSEIGQIVPQFIIMRCLSDKSHFSGSL